MALDVIIASFDDHHLHVLFRCPDARVRHWIGLAKKHTSLVLRQRGVAFDEKGGMWGKRCKVEPVADRSHQLWATLYVLDHEERRAAVWALPVVRTSAELQRLREKRDAKRQTRGRRK